MAYLKDDLKHELIRKALHLSSIWIPLSALLFNFNLIRILLITLTIILLSLDYLRIGAVKGGQWLNNILTTTGLCSMFRAHEKNKICGATYMLISASFCSIIMDSQKFALCFSILIICDTVAAIVGKSVGRIALFGKTLEGTLAFFISALAVSLLFYIFMPMKGYILPLCAASVITTFVELFSKAAHIDDNLSVPITFWLSMVTISSL